MKIITLILCAVFSLSVFSAAAPKLENIDSVEIEYWKWTGNREVSSWDLVFSPKDLQPLKAILMNANPVDKKDTTWFVSSLEGEIKTQEGDYELRFGREKIRPTKYRISITPIVKWWKSQPETEHFHLYGKDCFEFRNTLNKIIASKINRKPDRIKKE